MAQLSGLNCNDWIYSNSNNNALGSDGVSQLSMPATPVAYDYDDETRSDRSQDFTFIPSISIDKSALQQLANVTKLDYERDASMSSSQPIFERAAPPLYHAKNPSRKSALSLQAAKFLALQPYISTYSTPPLWPSEVAYEMPLALPRDRSLTIDMNMQYCLDATVSFDQRVWPLGAVVSYSLSGPMSTHSRPMPSIERSRSRTTGPSAQSMPIPQLVRTSKLKQSQSSNVKLSFNPYVLYSTGRAELRLQGDLIAITRDWTPAKLDMQRRLVEFNRSQTENVVTARFETVTLEERNPNNICVSCIYWRARNEYIVTSVDIIALLQRLIAVKFTVEEKNRIRRNLEEYKPEMISKLGRDTAEVFRLIMEFPNPRPRNIQKEIKIFPWSMLPNALSKIFGKYSVSSASTAGYIPRYGREEWEAGTGRAEL